MQGDRPRSGPITLWHLLPLYYVLAIWAAANALATLAGGGWRRHLLATLVSSVVTAGGIVATFRVGLWLERRSRVAPESEWKRALVVFYAGLAVTLLLTLAATQCVVQR
jgi:hypothetical protein